jgi:uncharacterized protein YqeY
MTLKERISADYMTAFKTKNTLVKNLLSVVKGEIQTIEKNTGVESMSDEEVLKILAKTAKSLKESIEKGNDEAKAELEIIEAYMPKQMSRDEIVSKMVELKAAGVTNIGQVMKEFAGLPVDRKVVSEVAKEVLQ